MGHKGGSGSVREGGGGEDASYLPSADLGASLAATAGSGCMQVCMCANVYLCTCPVLRLLALGDSGV